MEQHFEALCARYEELEEASVQNEVILDVPRYRRVLQEKAQLEPAVLAWRDYRRLLKDIGEAEELREDPDFRETAQEELKALYPRREEAESALKVFLIPRDRDDDRSVIMEIRPAAGGEEAALFAGLLTRMYQRYAERHGFQAEMIDVSDTELGGVKEAVFSLNGMGAYARMKYESGVHRIQRVPVTETAGRIHTSTATVAVLPEAEDVEVTIREDELRIDTYRASGHGGQYINRTDSAVRITHLPTGLVVTCQDEKSQLKNKEKAMKVLKARLYDLYRTQQDAEYAENRRRQVGSGERNERIRTYNFREGRVTDHRIGLTLYRLDEIIDGDLDEIIDALTANEQTEKLKRLAL
ncbi:MAG: peptide chain release factor 1 [Clostridia bacterium]|nr:peptide chain release factor 1 [Clostridia bacterium]